VFPQFNIHSTPLLILVLQGLIFAGFLFYRFAKKKQIADLLVASLLVIMAYHRTAYTIGFMGWYDTFQNTKINYFLVSLDLAMGPMIYLYLRSMLKPKIRFGKKDWLHFVPVVVFILYRLVVLLHDAGQPDWAIGYEGEWQRDIHLPYVMPFHRLLEYSSALLYLAFSVQLLVQYREKIRQYFSNTYRVELRWLQVFLSLYIFLFVYGTLTDIVDAFIVELHYVNVWWVHFFYAIAMVFVGMKAWFTNLQKLHELTFDMPVNEEALLPPATPSQDYEKEKQVLIRVMEEHQPYLNNNYTLRELAETVGLSLNEVSEIINAGFGCNFNEFINRYRVEEMKKRLLDPRNDHLSILAIAFDSGFNSKATFNRIFKQFTGTSPSQFKKMESS
jgi:AraC-like DNA-binding protein/glucose uptake protein GlcU